MTTTRRLIASLRSVAAVLAGYVFFAVCSFAVFGVSCRKRRQRAPSATSASS